MMPLQQGAGSSGCSWARTPEYSPSAPASTSAGSAETAPERRSRTTTCTPDGDWVNSVNTVPARTADGPSRARTASSRIICSSPRWIEYCGQRYPMFRPDAKPQIRLPCRSKCTCSAVGIPVAASASPRPSSVSSRTACGIRLMPTPSGRSVTAASMTSTSIPAACSESAAVSPPMPAPATITFTRP
jgi:hypothetical protein